MKYNLSKKQIIAESNRIRSEFRFSKLEPKQKRYIYSYIKKHKKALLTLLFLAIGETLIGIALPAISHFYLEKSFDLMNYGTFLIVGISLIVLLGLYLVNSYFRIYKTQQFSMQLINDVREDWYKYYLKHNASFGRHFDGKKLMTKMLYHIQLLRMGLQNIISLGLQSALLYIAILIFSFLFNSKLFLLLWLAFPLLVVVFVINDYIGKHYITREQTFNSRIVKHLTDSLINFDLLKAQAREKEQLKQFDNLLDIDAFFRIRRQLWIQFSNRILYGIIVLVGIAFYFIQIYWPFIEFDSVTNVAATGLILGYFMRILFSTARVGIFYEAYTLGLKLVVPGFEIDNIVKKSPKWSKLRLHGSKASLVRKSYIKNFDLKLNKKDRILIFSEDAKGKSTLANVLTGKRSLRSLFITLDKRRLKTESWSAFQNNNFLISDNFKCDASIGEILLAKNKHKIDSDDIENTLKVLNKFKIFDFLFEYKEFLGKDITPTDLSRSELILIQIAHCLLNEKTIISIDHSVIDNFNDEIKAGLEALESSSKDSTILFFSSTDNNNFKYAKKYKLGKTEFKEV